jgi:hypothetical protein
MIAWIEPDATESDTPSTARYPANDFERSTVSTTGASLIIGRTLSDKDAVPFYETIVT